MTEGETEGDRRRAQPVVTGAYMNGLYMNYYDEKSPLVGGIRYRNVCVSVVIDDCEAVLTFEVDRHFRNRGATIAHQLELFELVFHVAYAVQEHVPHVVAGQFAPIGQIRVFLRHDSIQGMARNP